MIAAFMTVLLPLTTFVTLGQQQACPVNFFGENCMYQCKCFASCNVDGTCTTNKCELKYFGPMCQYYDGINANFYVIAEKFLYDNDEETCNPNPAAMKVTVILDVPIPFLWFRIYVRNNSELVDFNVKLNQTIDCLNMRKFSKDNFVDATCDNSRYGVQELLVDGPIAGIMCSLYISLGRNAALKQKTYQSSTIADGTLSLSQNAVDGSPYISYLEGSCTHTKPEDRPEWRLTYNRLQILLFVVILNRDELIERLVGFTFEGLSDKKLTNTLLTDQGLPSLEYRFSLFVSRDPTRYLRIRGARRGNNSQGILTLCEVQAYSETICPMGKFGLWCQNTCSCQKNETCNSVTGVCGPGCPAGFYGLGGFGCSLRCINCKDDVCDQHGKCDKCIPGYRGENCKIDCRPGFYGQDCTSKCSPGCVNRCFAVNGSCSCRNNFAPPDCKACIPRFYGQHCTSECSSSCAETCGRVNGTCLCRGNFAPPDCIDCVSLFFGQNCTSGCSSSCAQMCEKVNGTCLCRGNFAPPDCRECTEKYYGPNCNTSCSDHCTSGVCSSVNGNCATCLEGYFGLHCESVTLEKKGSFFESHKGWLYIAIPVCIGFVVAIVVFLFCVTHDDDENSEMSEDTGNSKGQSF